MTDDISKVMPFWEWKEKQKAIDAEANGGMPFLRATDWYHQEYGKYVATQRQGYASFNKGTLTVDVGQFLKDTRTESATTEKSVAMRYLEEKQADTMKQFHENYTESATTPADVDGAAMKARENLRQVVEASVAKSGSGAVLVSACTVADLFADYATLARQLAKSERDCTELRALLTAQNAAIARTDDLARQLAEAKEKAEFQKAIIKELLPYQERAIKAESQLAEATRLVDTPAKPRYNCPTEAHDGEE